MGDGADNGGEEGEATTVLNSEDSRQWEQGREAEIVQQPQYGVTGEEFENVWDGESSGTVRP